MSDNIKNVNDALVYIVDCTLATVEQFALIKRPPVGQLKRQIDIAQIGINCIKWGDTNIRNSHRVKEVMDKFDCNVSLWYNHFRN